MATSPHSRRSISISEMHDLVYVGFWRRALAASIDNVTWFFGVLMLLGWLPVNLANVSETAAYIGVVVVFFVIGELMIVAGKRKQRLGDKAAGTVVVQRAPRSVQEQAA